MMLVSSKWWERSNSVSAYRRGFFSIVGSNAVGIGAEDIIPKLGVGCCQDMITVSRKHAHLTLIQDKLIYVNAVFNTRHVKYEHFIFARYTEYFPLCQKSYCSVLIRPFHPDSLLSDSKTGAGCPKHLLWLCTRNPAQFAYHACSHRSKSSRCDVRIFP